MRRSGPSLLRPATLWLAALVLVGCSREDEPKQPPVRPVLSLVVEPQTDEVFGPFTGTVQPRYQADIGFRAAGRMVSRNFNVGDLVKQGDLLASLDPSVARFNVASAKADLANSEATLANASSTQNRKAALLKSGSAPQSDVDTAVASLETAQAKVNQAQASLVKAKEQLDFTELRSDYNGVITKWSLEVGQVVTAGQTVVTIARPDERDGVFDLPDDVMAKVPVGAGFAVALQADPGVVVPGKVREIAPEADAATRTRRIRLTLSDVPDSFRLGTTVTMTLVEKQAPVVRLPAAAVLDRDGTASVWVVGPDSKAVLRPVSLGGRAGDLVEVKTGVDKGDRVITAGIHSLSEGQAIKVEP